MAVRRVVDGLLYAMPPVSTKPGSHLQKYMKASSARPRDEHQTGSGRVTQPRIMVKSARRRAMLRVQRRTAGQRVAKNHYVRRQLRRPRSFPLSQNFARCCTKHCNRVPKLHLFRARPKSTHPWTPINSLTPTIPKESWGIAARLCENRGQPRSERGGCLAFGRAACIARRSSPRLMRPSIQSPRRRAPGRRPVPSSRAPWRSSY